MPIVYLLLLVLVVAVFLWVRRLNAAPVTPLAEFNLVAPEVAIERDGLDRPVHRAIVLLSGDPTLSLVDITRFMLKRWPELGVIDPDLDAQGMQRALKLEGADVRFELCGRMKHAQTLESRLGANPIWPGADRIIEGYVATILVEADVEASRPGIDFTTVLSQAVFGLVRSCPTAAGVYWPAAGHVLSRQQALAELGVNMKLWVGVFASRDQDGRVVGFTQGMRVLGGIDFEVIDAPENPDEVRGRLYGLIDYAAASGFVLHNGDTIGVDEHERITLKKQPAELGRDGWVFRLNYLKESPQHPWR